VAGLLFALTAFGCGANEPPAPTTVDREAFIATWVDLRQAALESPTGQASPDRIGEILREHDTTAEAMEDFVRVRGGDATYMRAVWEEVETRMRTEAGEISPPAAEPDDGG
jgi:hypothetical protein